MTSLQRYGTLLSYSTSQEINLNNIYDSFGSGTQCGNPEGLVFWSWGSVGNLLLVFSGHMAGSYSRLVLLALQHRYSGWS